MARGIVLWFTGLSGSGKTTIATLLKVELERLGKQVEMLDGDVVRQKLHADLDFSRDGIGENNRRVAELAAGLLRQNHFILVPIISPYQEDRRAARDILGENFIEIYINCPLEECMKRDVKGLYKEACEGKRSKLIGMEGGEHPYEAPVQSDIEIKTSDSVPDESVSYIIEFLSSRNHL